MKSTSRRWHAPYKGTLIAWQLSDTVAASCGVSKRKVMVVQNEGSRTRQVFPFRQVLVTQRSRFPHVPGVWLLTTLVELGQGYQGQDCADESLEEETDSVLCLYVIFGS